MTKDAPSSTSASEPRAGAPRAALTGRRLALVLAALVAALVALDRLGGAALDALYAQSPVNPVHRIAASGARNVVLGSSVSKYAVDPAHFLPRSFNAGANGQGMFYAVALLRNLPGDAPVDRAVLGLDPAELHSGMDDPNLPHLARLSPLARNDPWLRKMLAAGDPLFELKALSRLYFHRGSLVSALKGLLRPETLGDGFEPLTGVAHEGQRPDPASLEGAPLAPAPESLSALEAGLAAANERGIQVVAVVIPLFGRERAEEPKFAKLMAAARERLAAAGACDLTAVETPELDAIRSDPSLYFDGPHMNAKGARRYSRELARLVRERCG